MALKPVGRVIVLPFILTAGVIVGAPGEGYTQTSSTSRPSTPRTAWGTPDHVLLLFEMTHEFRIVPLDERPHLPSTIRQWLGDSRGHWEAETLVVETTNFSNQQLYRRLPMGTTRLVERPSRDSTVTP